MADAGCFELGDFTLESGAVLPETRLAYQTWGTLNEARDNAVVVFHSLTGDADVTTWWSGLFGPGKAVDPEQHFVICANLLQEGHLLQHGYTLINFAIDKDVVHGEVGTRLQPELARSGRS